MGFIRSIKKSLYAKALASKAKVLMSKPRFQGWNTAEVYSILFEYSGLFSTKEIEKLADSLRVKGKNVHLLCYTGATKKDGLAYKTFDDKDISFNLVPKSNIVSEFTERHVNILYNLIPLEREISEYIATTCNADFKIGLFDENRSGLDLMINLKEPNLKEFIKTAERVLQKTNS